ncbi:MAG: MFS transporter [Clostridiales bacterium]|nr:MFS transporter [Clostridiales bacterium]
MQGKKRLRVFAVASFLNDLGSDIIYPIWPLFVTQVLKANMAALGFLDGLGDALVSLSQAASGYVSDRIRRRKVFIWTGYLCGSLSRLGYALSAVWQHLIPFRILDRVGKIRSAPRDAMVADMTTASDRGRSFGLLRAMDNLGAVCGIVICIAFINLLGYRLLFALAALPSLLSALLIFALIKEKRADSVKLYKGLSLKDLGNDFRVYLLLSAIFALGAFSYSFLLIYAKIHGFKVVFVPVLYLIFTATASLFSFPFGRLSDRIGGKAVLYLAFSFWAAVCAGMIASPGRPLIILIFVLYGLHKAALEPVQKTLVCELSPLPFRASCLGGFQMIIGLCSLPASLVAGLLWDKIGVEAPFVFSLVLTGLAAGLLLFVQKKSSP